MRNILFLTHPESDYGGAMLYQGLCEILGDDRVWDYPIKWSYHGEVHVYSTPSIAHGITDCLPWFRRRKCNWPVELAGRGTLLSEDLERLAAQRLSDGFFTCVVVESERHWAKEAYARLRNTIEDARVPVVVHDGEDHDRLDILKTIPADILLKRELPKAQYTSGDFKYDNTRVVAFPFSCPETKILEALSSQTALVHYDAALLCGNTHPWRQRAANALRDDPEIVEYVAIAPDEGNTDSDKLLVWPDYIRTMAKSRFAVNVRGFGYDTVRFWEAALCSALLTLRPEIHIPHPYEDGNTALFFDSAKTLCDIVKYTSKFDTFRIYVNGYKHTLQYHTNAARARSLLEIVDEFRADSA